MFEKNSHRSSNHFAPFIIYQFKYASLHIFLCFYILNLNNFHEEIKFIFVNHNNLLINN